MLEDKSNWFDRVADWLENAADKAEDFSNSIRPFGGTRDAELKKIRKLLEQRGDE